MSQLRSSEFARAVDEVVANKEQSMVPLMKSTLIKQAMREGAKEQARVLLAQDFEQEAPVVEGGLVASPDGLSWSLPSRGSEALTILVDGRSPAHEERSPVSFGAAG